jgi:hypothetical protein
VTDRQWAAVVEMAKKRVGTPRKGERGWNWACYCPVCIEIRKIEVI